MTFRIPPEFVIAPGFTVTRPENLFIFYLLNRNWESWAQTFLPTEWFFKNTSNEKLDPPAFGECGWTVVADDNGDYLESGLTNYGEGNGSQWSNGYVRTLRSSSSRHWKPVWTPDYRLLEFTRVEFPYTYTDSELQVLRTVWVDCELCGIDELGSGECRHWSNGEIRGSGVMTDFPLPAEDDVIELLKRVARDATLGPLSCLAASILVSEFLNPDAVADQVQRWTQVAVERARELSESSREIAIDEPLLLPEVTAELNK